jgi:three-Cys-motif partner protein
MAKDLHGTEFDEATNVKLAIYRDYLKEWLPVFLAKEEPIWTTINIFDFFAGPGTDAVGNKGTPLLILDELDAYISHIRNKNLKVNLYFNEYDKAKAVTLKHHLAAYENLTHCKISVQSLDFKLAFEAEYPKMKHKDAANLLFLDQYGIKHITDDIFRRIADLKKTDFLFFISSSLKKRFAEHPAMKQYVRLDPKDIEKTPHHKIHRLVLEYYKGLIAPQKEYYMAPFSLKKKAALYGIIFGSNHLLGIEKFLKTCWGIDKERGEANFDIDEDKITAQLDLFKPDQKPKKVEVFETDLKDRILKKELMNEKEIYLFTILNGFLPSHTRKIVTDLVKERKIAKVRLELEHKVCKKNKNDLIYIKIL